MKLDETLQQLPNPEKEKEIIWGLPCDLCNKKHTKVVAVNIDDFLVWEIHSPCLDKIARQAVKRIG